MTMLRLPRRAIAAAKMRNGEGRRRSALFLARLSGQRQGDSLSMVSWDGTLLLE